MQEKNSTTGQSGQANQQSQGRLYVDLVGNAVRNNRFSQDIKSKFSEIAQKSNGALTVHQIQRFWDAQQQNTTGAGTTSAQQRYSEEDILVAKALWNYAQNQPDFDTKFDRKQLARDLNIHDNQLDALFSKQGQREGTTIGRTTDQNR